MQNEKNFPFTYGYLAVFLGTVSLVCSFIAESRMFFAIGATSLLLGAGYVLAVRSARARGTEQ